MEGELLGLGLCGLWVKADRRPRVSPSRVSSEDGEETSAYFYESDDSIGAQVKAPYSGEMDLLGEILDTLSTHSSDQGKLAAAKSLDFFRSMDDIDYRPTVSWD